MIGSIIGDIVGSIYEFGNIKTKDFEFLSDKCNFTDDSVLTVATADWILKGGEVAKYYSRYGYENPWPMGGYGGDFQLWIVRTNRQNDFRPYNSMPGLPVHNQHPEFTQTHVHRVRDAIQPSHPLLSPSSPAPNPSQHQSLSQ